jgi:hypothetical protein
MTKIIGFGHLNFGNWNLFQRYALCAMRLWMSDAQYQAYH